MNKSWQGECPDCKERLFGPVKYCPFCGKPVEAPSLQPRPKGPIIKELGINPREESGVVEVTAVAHSEDGLIVKQAEYWIGNDPGPGNGTPMEAVAGSFKSSKADITTSIDISKFKPGKYPINVRSADVRGEWGSPQVIILPVEEPIYGPAVETLNIGSPDESDAVMVTAVAHSQDGLNIAGAEWWIENDPGCGNGTPMVAVGGSFNSSIEDIRASIDVSKFKPGSYSINVRSKDIRGIWGIPQTSTLTVIREEIKQAGGAERPKPDRHWVRNAIACILIAACLFIGYKIISRPKEKAQLFVSTSPAGASLIIDGKSMGRTDKAGMSVAIESGTHHIVAEKEGYLRNEQDISVSPGEKRSVAVTLEKRGVDFAEVRITTIPDQAVVFVDGNRKGRTPLTLKNITPGEHSFTMSKGGYEERNEQITVASGEKKELEYVLILKQQPATLQVNTSPSGAELTFDETQFGKTPASVRDIAPGEHSLTISKEGYEKRNEKINIASGEKKTVEYTLTQVPIPIKATLSVNTSPSGAQLSVDRIQVGTTPANIQDMAAGEHLLTLWKTGYLNRNERINIASGEKKSVEYALTPIPTPGEETATLYVNTSPPGAYVSVDGVPSGRTPMHLQKLSTGEHVVSVGLAGYESKEEIVSLSKGDRKLIRLILLAKRRDTKKDIEDDLKEAIAAFNNSQYDVAIKMCQSILRKDPSNSTAQQYLQRAKEEQERAINSLLKPGSVRKIK
jgi:hypothetical protein